MGCWRGPDHAKGTPRPTVVEFANPRHRDHFLAVSGELTRKTGGTIIVEPDNTADWRKPKEASNGTEKEIEPSIKRTLKVEIARVREEASHGNSTKERTTGGTKYKEPGKGAGDTDPAPKNLTTSRA